MRALSGVEIGRLNTHIGISAEAAAAIATMEARTARPTIPAPDDQAGWDQLFDLQERAVDAANARTLERYRPALRTEQVAGLAVEVVTPAKTRFLYHSMRAASFLRRS